MSPNRLAVAVAAVLLTACGGAPPEEDRSPDDPPAGIPDDGTELLDAVRQPLERADSANDRSLGRKDQLDEALERSAPD